MLETKRIKTLFYKGTFYKPKFFYSTVIQNSRSFLCSSFGIPHPNKETRPFPNLKSKGCGEDSYLYTSRYMIAADGVGGWASKNISSDLYSRQLVHNITKNIEEEEDLRKLINTSNIEIKDIHGSTTVILAKLKGDLLKVANFGDCGLRIIRNSKIVFQTKEQQHFFNCPYQLSQGETTKKIKISEFTLNAGDIVIMGTDGVFDNLFNEKIIEICANATDHHLSKENQVEYDLAKNIAYAAFEVSNSNEETPFSLSSKNRFNGGKPDDITVIVGKVE